jgi:CheY-like chemotaxis protein
MVSALAWRDCLRPDLHDTRRYLRSILEPFCKVVEARDGVEALEKFDEAAPDLVVADITLPRVSCQYLTPLTTR